MSRRNIIIMRVDMERLKRCVELIYEGACEECKNNLEDIIEKQMGLIFDEEKDVWFAVKVDDGG